MDLFLTKAENRTGKEYCADKRFLLLLIFHQCRGAYSNTVYAALMRAGFLQGKQDIFPNEIQTFSKSTNKSIA